MPGGEARKLGEWFAALPVDDVSELVDLDGGDAVELMPGQGLVRKST